MANGSQIADVEVALNYPYSGRVTDANGNWTESLLVIDDPANPVLGTTVYQGQLLASNKVIFRNIRFVHTGSSGNRRIRIVNLRADIPPISESLQIAPRVLGVVSATGLSSIPFSIVEHNLGFILPPGRFSITGVNGSVLPQSGTYSLQFEERAANQFRRRNTATAAANPLAIAAQNQFGIEYGTESGIYLPAVAATNGANTAGLATQGTRLLARFTNLQAGTTVNVGVNALGGSSGTIAAQLIQSDANGAGSFAPVAGDSAGRAALTISQGSATAVWEVVQSDPSVTETIRFEVVLSGSGATVTGQLGPISTDGTPSATLQIPRLDAPLPVAQSGLRVPRILQFEHVMGAALPAAVSVPVTSTTGPLTFTARAVSGLDSLGATPPDGNWLSVTPASATTPASLQISVSPQALATGSYEGFVNVVSGASNQTIYVVLTVRQPADGSAPVPQCSAGFGVPPNLRSAGLAEQAGDLVLTCFGGSGGSVLTDVRLSFSAPVVSEGLLLLDEPGPFFPGQSIGGNVFRGQITGPNTLLFRNVPVAGSQGSFTTLRVTNVRLNLGGLRPGTNQAPTTITVNTRLSTISSTGNPQTLGFLQEGMHYQTLDANGAPAANLALSAGAFTDGSLRITEGFSSSFRRRNLGGTFADPLALMNQHTPGAIYNTETGFYNSQFDSAGGLATQGTRLMARFIGLPAGARLFVSVNELGGTVSRKARLTQTDANGAGAFQAITSPLSAPFGPGEPSAAEITVSGGTGIAVWEIVDNVNPLVLEAIRFGVRVSHASGGGLGAVSVAGLLAPISTATGPDASAPLPRFNANLPVSTTCTACLHPFTAQFLTSTSPSVTIPVTADIDPVVFTVTVTNGTWLRVNTGVGATPATLTISADTAGLAPGTYNGSVTVGPHPVPVTLTVAGPPPTPQPEPPPSPASMSLSIDRILTSFAKGEVVTPITAFLDGTPGLAFTATPNVAWLQVTPRAGSVPATLTITPNTTLVEPGEYLASVIVAAPGAPSQTLAIRASVTEAPQFIAVPGAITLTGTSAVLYITSRGRQTKYTAEAISDGAWLSVTPESGTTPVNLRITANTALLPSGRHSGTIRITSAEAGGGGPLNVPVTVEVP